MKLLEAWLRSKNWTAHGVAMAGVALAGIVNTDPQARDFLLNLLKSHPTLGSDLVILAAIVAKYSHSSSPAGKVAAAEAVLEGPDPPSPAAIEAAQVKPPLNLSSNIPQR